MCDQHLVYWLKQLPPLLPEPEPDFDLLFDFDLDLLFDFDLDLLPLPPPQLYRL